MASNNIVNSNELDKKLEYFEQLRTKREKWNNVWDDLKKYVCPQTESNKNIFDSTSIWSREQLASGLQSLMVNPAIQWFNLKVEEEAGAAGANNQELMKLPEVKSWAQQVEATLLGIFNSPASNFYNQVHEFFLSLAAFGTGVFYIEEDLSLPEGLFFRNISLKECYFEENRLGQVDCLHRLFTLKAAVAASYWKDDRMLQEKAAKEPDELVEILHVVGRSSKDKQKKQSSRESAFESAYIDLAERRMLSQGSYDYFPFLAARGLKEEGEPYGYAPAHHVLPDIKLLNSLRQITLKVAQKQLDPPLLVPKDGYYLPLYTTPGSVNFYRNGVSDKIVPLSGMENILPTEIEQNQCREAIYKAFYVDIFRMQKENKEMTATEVQARSEEQMRMMAPMTSRIETELLNPLISIVYKLMVKYRKLPEIEGLGLPQNIRAEYVSPLTRAQKSGQVHAVERLLEFLQRSGIAATIPDIYDNINFDEALRLFFELKGAPQTLLKSQQEIMQIRQQRKIMQLQQMQQLQNQQAKA